MTLAPFKISTIDGFGRSFQISNLESSMQRTNQPISSLPTNSLYIYTLAGKVQLRRASQPHTETMSETEYVTRTHTGT